MIAKGTAHNNGARLASYLITGKGMQEAYRRVRLDRTAYGCFMMGPSATADIEATLVHGAQGVRSLNVFFLPRS